MRIIFLFSIIFSWVNLIMAQRITVSEEVNLDSGWEYEIMGKYNGNILLAKYNDQSLHLMAFDNQMVQVWDRSHPFEARRILIHKVIGLGKNVGVVYNEVYKDSTLLLLRWIKSDANYEDTVTLYTTHNKADLRKVHIEISNNKRWLIAHFLLKDKSLVCLRYDLWAKKQSENFELDVSGTEFRNNFRKLQISDEGTIFISMESQEQLFSNNKPIWQFFSIPIGSPEAFKQEIPTDEIYFDETSLAIDNKQDKLIMAGVFKTRSSDRYNHGIAFCFLGHKTPIVPTIQLKRFSTWLEPHLKDKLIKESVQNFTEGLEIRDILPRQDGGFVLLMEKKEELTRLNSTYRADPFRTNVSTDYFFEDIIAVGVSQNCDIEWQKFLVKKQYSYDDAGIYSSYGLFKSPQITRILYNDEIKNENTVSEYLLTGSGAFQRKILMSTDRQDIKLQFGSSVQIDLKEIIIPSVWKSSLKLVQLRYP
jgi:hypothetical protein